MCELDHVNEDNSRIHICHDRHVYEMSPRILWPEVEWVKTRSRVLLCTSRLMQSGVSQSGVPPFQRGVLVWKSYRYIDPCGFSSSRRYKKWYSRHYWTAK
jgi:hypothetical protein